jgi:hypothetical protein
VTRPSFFLMMTIVTGLTAYGSRTTYAAPAAQAPSGTARIVIKVMLSGKPPAAAKLPMAADATCVTQNGGKAVLDPTVEADANGNLKDVLVYVKDVVGSYPAPTTAFTLDQSGCMYKPHVFGVRAGQPVEILNSDPTLHNIHPLPRVNPGFNIGQPVKGLKSIKTFAKPEAPFHVKCDVHGWMSAYIGVFSHPFFGVSNDTGQVELQNLPAGTFQIQAWQEKYGVQTQAVTVAAGESKEIVFTYKAQ